MNKYEMFQWVYKYAERQSEIDKLIDEYKLFLFAWDKYYVFIVQDYEAYIDLNYR